MSVATAPLPLTGPAQQRLPLLTYPLAAAAYVFGFAAPSFGFGASTSFVSALVGGLLLYAAFGVQITGSRLGMLRATRNAFSLARLQMAGWTWLILSAILTIAEMRLRGADPTLSGALNIYVPTNLFYVMGISLFTGAAAPSLLSLKTQTENTQGEIDTTSARMQEKNVTGNGQVLVRNLSENPKLGDLIEGDDLATAGTVDLSKVQQLLVTLLLLGVYATTLWRMFQVNNGFAMPAELRDSLVRGGLLLCGYADVQTAADAKCGTGWSAMPDFSGTMVTLLAVSHGGYLAYKALPRKAADQTT